jgi:hypothetical protein
VSDQLVEALDWVLETWSAPVYTTSREAAHEAGAQLLEVFDEEYGYADPNDVIPDLVNELIARSGERGDVWLGRTAALGCVIEAMVQAQAAEQASLN